MRMQKEPSPLHFRFLLPVLIMIFLVFPGCSNRQDDDFVLNVQEYADRLLEKVAFQDTLAEVEKEMIAVIYDISAEDLSAQKVYIGTGATAEEIAVFEAVDGEAVKRVEAAVRQRIEDQKLGFADYLPAELPKLEDPFVLVRGRYVILCVSDHKEEVMAELKELL